jgi:chemotaxis protein histidine kinase CheA
VLRESFIPGTLARNSVRSRPFVPPPLPAAAAAGPAAPSRKAKGLLKGAVTTKKEKPEAAVKTQRRKYQKSAAQQKKEAEAKKKRLAETRKKSAREKKSEKAAPVRATRSTRSASATTKSATTRSKRKRAGDSSDSSSSALSDVESPVAKRRKDARRILEAETERKRAQRAKEQADAELRAAQKAAKELEQKAREAAVRAEAAARAAEAARTPAKSPRGGGGGGGGDAPVEMWKVYICWRDEELPVKIRSDATVGSLAWLISSKTDGKLQADRCELTFGVTKLASVPSQELLATIGVVQGARFGLTLRPKGAGARQAPSPVLSPRAKAAAKARLEAARGVERAAMASLDEVSRYRTASGRAPNQSWTEPEALALVDGVAAFGLGEWAKILDAVWLKHVDFPKRSATDLKDKWRNLCNSADKPAGFKFRLAYVTPELLARTRDVRAETQRKRREDDDKWEAEAAARRAEIRRRSLNA